MRAESILQTAIGDFEFAFGHNDDEEMARILDIVVSHRTSHCRACCDKMHLSPAVQACKDEWERMKREACEVHGGCPTPGCVEKGPSAWVCMSADHIDPSLKTHALGDFTWWSCNGGVPAMRREAQKVQWMCWCCHKTMSTSSTGRTNTRTRPTDVRVREKEAYVNAKKLEIGQCQYPQCNRIVTPETVRQFDFDHTDPTKKATHETRPDLIRKGNKGGVAGIVNNTYKAKALEFVQPDIDKETAMCELMCSNCHYSRKPRKYGRWQSS
jgi:hypothetical protein